MSIELEVLKRHVLMLRQEADKLEKEIVVIEVRAESKRIFDQLCCTGVLHIYSKRPNITELRELHKLHLKT